MTLRRLSLALFVLCGALGACRRTPTPPGQPARAPVEPTRAMQQPKDGFDTIRSADGVLETTLTASTALITFAGKTFPSMVYNGRYLPPVLRVRRGDVLKLHMINALPKDEFTNVHYHGTSTSPKSPGDNPFLHIMPAEKYDYRLEFAPDHDQGLFWYHPHPHGKSEEQVLGGMSGVLVVEGFLDEYYPSLRGVKEEILMLKALQLPGAKDDDPHTKNINGQLDATFRIRPGELQFWRIANIAADAYFYVRIDGHRFWLLANDANALRRPMLVDSLFLPPGARAEVILQGGPAGDYGIQQLAVDTGPQGDPNPAIRLGTLTSEGSSVDSSAAVSQLQAMGDLAEAAAEIDALRNAKITRRRTFVFSETADGDHFFINGKQFDMNRVDTRVKVGDVEEWTIRNTTGEVHAFHIHQTDFLVTEIDGVAQAPQSLRDTINLPYQKKGKPGEVKVLMPFPSPRIAGRFVYHCHILEHEDGGMMAVIELNP